MITSVKTFENGNTLTLRTDVEGAKDCLVIQCEFTHTPSEEDKVAANILIANLLKGYGWNKLFCLKWVS